MNKSSRTIEYEKMFAEWFGAGRAFSFWKARVGLYAILKAMGVGAGDEVVIPGYTCVVDVNPVLYLKAKPIYVDVEPNTFNIDVKALEEKITPNTKVIMAQHTYGYPCDMDAIVGIAEKSGTYVIEDCCHAFGSRYKGRTAGTFGQVAYFSSQWNKPYTTGLGGMVLVRDGELANKIESLCSREMVMPSKKEVLMLTAQLAVYRAFIYPRTTALAQNAFRLLTRRGVVVGSSSTSELGPAQMEPDYFKAMSCVQARSGLKQLRKVEGNIAHRKRIAQYYDDLLEKKGWVTRQYDRSTSEPVMVRYPVRIIAKERALHEAAKSGVELGDWFECPLHATEAPLEAYDYKTGTCPEGEKASAEVVNLPVHPRVNQKTAEKTVEFITRFAQVR